MRTFIKDYLKDKTKICPKRLSKKIRKVIIMSLNTTTGKQTLKSKNTFDIEGNILEEKEYCREKVIRWIKYIYSDNELAEILEGKRDKNDGSNKESDFSFSSQAVKSDKGKGIEATNEKGQRTISTFWLTEELASKKTFNEKDICIEYVEFSKKGGVTNRVTYDKDGQMIEARRFRSDGKPLNSTVNYFDGNHRLCRSDSVSRTGYSTHVTVLKYDSLGLLAETIGNPVNPDHAFADEKGGSCGRSYKYFYTIEGLLEIKNHYQGGKHMGSHVFSYEYW